MQIHELNNFTGTLGSGAYLAVDDGNDTGKLSTQQLLAATEARIDNIIAGEAPSAEEIVDARLGADGVTYTSLGTAIRTQFTDVKSDSQKITGVSRIPYISGAYIALNNSTADITSPTSDSNYSYAVIPCSEGDVFSVSGQGGSAPRVWGFIDSNNAVLLVSAPTITISDVRLTAPPDSAYLVLNTKADAVSYKGDFIPFVLDPISEQLSSSSDLVGACTNVFINRYSHEESSGNGYYTSGYIKVNAGQVYYITANRQGDNQYDTSLNFYNESKTFVSTSRNTFDGTKWCPSSNGYVRLTGYGTIPKCITNGLFVRKELDAINPLKGKTLIWFGTSIPAGQKTTAVTVDGIYCFNNYPDMVGKLLDCKVINQAIGTSCARTGIQSNVTEDDPMGVHGKQYEIATRALTQTLAEKQDFIDNWTTKWGPNGTLHLYNAPGTLPDYQKNVILNSSYETLLTPYLDGTYEMPDYFIFDHGYNDGAYYGNPTAGEEMSVIPDDPTNRHYFIGALNMLFKMILEANPKAKIILIDHFCSQDRSWVVDAQKVLSEQWEFPTMELYKSSGISMQEIDVNGETKTIKQIYCPDGTHPHSDSTGSTNMMIARKLASWLKNII